MAREIAKAVITALLFLAISEGFASPVWNLRTSAPERRYRNIEHGEDLSSPGDAPSTPSLFLELTTASNIPEEIKEDISKLTEIVEEKEKELGHTMTRTELQQVEKELEELPWYKKLGNWFENAYHSTKNAIASAFTDDDARRDQRAFYRNLG
ncbi:unnamed protein product [Allacma fusca]|uniref:Uncharacterized protein n=1 Tax=Allacma fusca TaxID=39272 RepID=A0A8J2Q6C9_9HEXA|nr:unnamed protein product [Allacma fusca]